MPASSESIYVGKNSAANTEGRRGSQRIPERCGEPHGHGVSSLERKGRLVAIYRLVGWVALLLCQHLLQHLPLRNFKVAHYRPPAQSPSLGICDMILPLW